MSGCTNANLTQMRSLCFSSLRVPEIHLRPISARLDEFYLNPTSNSLSSILQEYINSDFPRVEQAWEFVMNMPENPNSDIWAALLSSSRLHGEVEMEGIAADELFKLGADSRPGAYMALSNVMAAAGKWDCVNEVRELMKQRRISKDTGFSWTEKE